MDFCILVHISRYTISFSYYTTDSNKFESYGEGLDSPLAIWFNGTNVIIGKDAKTEAVKGGPNAYYNLFDVMSRHGSFEYSHELHSYNKIILYVIRAGLKEFFTKVMKNYYGELDENISTVPLLISMSPDIESNDRTLLLRQLKDNGFRNIEEIKEYEIIRKTFNVSNAKAVLLLSSNGEDLFGSLSLDGKATNFKLEGEGKDPRVDKLVDLIWNRTQAENDFLFKKNEISELRSAAISFIQSGETERNGCIVFSNGYDYQYFLSKHDLNLYTQQDGGRVIRDIIGKLPEGVNKKDCQLILCNQASSNKFLHDLLKPEFSNMVIVRTAERELVLNKIIEYVNLKNFNFVPIENIGPNSPTGPTETGVRTGSTDTTGTSGSEGTTGTTIPLDTSDTTNEPTKVVDPTPRDKRLFKETKAVAIAQRKNGEEGKARNTIKDFLNDMHAKHVYAFDDELNALLENRSVPFGGDKETVVTEYKQPTPRDQRDKRIVEKEIDAKLLQHDKKAALAIVKEFTDAMHKRNIIAFDNDLAKLIDKINKS